MMAYFLFYVLAALSLRCFVWGLVKPERLFQFPTIFGAGWLFYMCPQALGAVMHPDKYPQWIHSDHGLELALLMCVACVQAGWSGFQYRRTENVPIRHSSLGYSDERLFQAGVVVYAIGFYGAYLLASLAGGFIEQFSGGGHYELEWSGLPVRYVFFAQLIYPGFAMVWLAFLYRQTTIRAVALFLFSLYPVATTVFLGRRAATAFLLLIIALGLYFVRRWTPPRPIVLAGFVAMAVFVVMAPQYRAVTQYGLDWERLREIPVEQTMKEVVSGESYAEFDALVAVVASFNEDKYFGGGSGIYNATVGQLVPRQLVGEEFKDSLFLDLWGTNEQAARIWAALPYGSNPTGVANAFTEFWFLGAMAYFFIAYWVRRLWEAALKPGNLGAQLWYIILSPFVPLSVIGSLSAIPGQLIGLYIFVGPLLWYTRQRYARTLREA